MKRRDIFIASIVLILSMLTFCSNQQDQAADEEAIKEIIHAQLQAVKNLSYEGEAAVWAHTPYIERQGVRGWDSVKVFYQDRIDGMQPGDTVYEYTASNFDIHINGTFASVFHDEQYDLVMNGERYSGEGRPHKFLEKINGEWKIISLF